MKFAAYILALSLIATSTFACSPPNFYDRKYEIAPLQSTNIALPAEFTSIAPEIQKTFEVLLCLATKYNMPCVKASQQLENGNSWSMVFKKNDEAKQIETSINFIVTKP